MAQLVRDRDSTSRAEHFLEYSLREWDAVPSYVADFPMWDDDEQLAFVHEWAIRESSLDVLADYERQGALTTRQRRRYDQLLAIVARHRPMIERLLNE